MRVPTEPAVNKQFSLHLVVTLAAAAGTFILVALLWRLSHILLVVFAGVLFGVFLDAIVRFVVRHTTLTRPLAFGLVLSMLVGLTIGFALWLAPDVATQLGQLRSQIPKAVDHLRAWAADMGWTAPLPQEIEEPETLVTETVTVGGLADVFSTLFGIFGNVLIALFIGIVIAARPTLYVGGLMHLVPQRRREDASEILARLGCAMRQWLVGRFASMGVIAVLTSVGLLLLGVKLWLALGLLAGLLEFIPFIGPALAFVPAVLIALMVDPTLALNVAILFGVVQLAESYLITPFIEQYVVSIPAALLIAFQAMMAILAGLLGILLATPLAVVIVVLVQMLYVRRTLGDPVAIAGSDDGKTKDDGGGDPVPPAGEPQPA